MTENDHGFHAHERLTNRQLPKKHHEHHATNINGKIAMWVTRVVGTMWCAYAFCFLALISLPAAIQGGIPTMVAWTAQTFIQLVLLSIIMVGQDIVGKAADERAEATYLDTEAILKEIKALHVRLT